MKKIRVKFQLIFFFGLDKELKLNLVAHMRRIFILASLSLLFTASLFSKFNNELDENDAFMEWWREARFGMFIHWGLYAIPAGEWNDSKDYAEWIRENAQIPLQKYDEFVAQFNPEKFDAKEWVKIANDAGMKYIIITSKHHDGFCLFDSKFTDFDICSTPYKKDILKQLSDAAHEAGIKIGFYYSIMDWHHPDYLPRRSWELNRPVEGAKFERYVAYVKNQLKELLTNYGEVAVLWFDGSWENTWNNKYGKELYNFVKELQPNIIINNRVGTEENFPAQGVKSVAPGDYKTPEQFIPELGQTGVDWETCMTMNDHWGYNKYDNNWKSTGDLIQKLSNIASKGGNFLLNVGPTAEGVFPEPSIYRLKEIGKWLKINGTSIYGSTAGPFQKLDWGCCTQKSAGEKTILFLHVFNWPQNGELDLPGIENNPTRVFLLSDKNQKLLRTTRYEDGLKIGVPLNPPDSSNSVLVLEILGKPSVYSKPKILCDYNIFIDSLEVTLSNERDDSEIRFSTDGSIPNINSQKYEHPITIKNSGVISARIFKNDKPVSPASQRSFKKVKPHTALNIENVSQGLKFKYYEGEWNQIPIFDSVTIVQQDTANNFTIKPLGENQFFGFQFDGFIKIPAEDVYKFFLASDDGSRLYIDNELIINNDYLHPMKEMSALTALSAGFHAIRVDFFQRSGVYGLEVLFATSKMNKQPIPDSLLFISNEK